MELSIRNVTKSYSDLLVLEDINMELSSGLKHISVNDGIIEGKLSYLK